MTTKRLLFTWAILALSAGLGSWYLHSSVSRAEARFWEEAKYEKPSKPLALTIAIALCNENWELRMTLIQGRTTCEQYQSEREGLAIQEGIEWHRLRQHQYLVAPRLQEYENSLTNIFWMMAVTLGLFAAVAFLLWCRSIPGPFIARKIREHAKRLPTSSDLIELGANRRIRQAESDFSALKTLHDNGVISDEMFVERKELLRQALDK